MDAQKYTDITESLFKTVNSLRLLNIILSVSTVILVFALIYTIQYKKIILVPNQIYDKIEVSDQQTLPDVIEEETLFLADLSQNFSPFNYDSRMKIFLRKIAPDVAVKFQDDVLKTSDIVKDKKYSQLFTVEKITIVADKLQAIAEGVETRYSEGVLVSSQSLYILFTYTKIGDKLFLKSLEKEEKK